MSKQIKGSRYPCLRYMQENTWVRELALSPERAHDYSGIKRFCFFALRLLADMMIGWDNR